MNKPQIRFKGFDEDWKQSSFGEVCTVYDGVHQTPHYTDSGVMFVSVENIQTLQSTKFISLESFNSDFNIVPEKNDILMTRIGDIGTANIVQSDEPLAYYVSLALLKSPSIDSSFFKSSISCPDTKRELWKRTLHVAFPKKINKNEISLVGIKYPSSSEQKAIGLFFAKIDEMVAEAEREVSRLEKFKQASLQKMFPRPGAITPEIRFAGFTDEWNIKSLGEIGSTYTGLSGKTKEDFGHGDAHFVTYMNVFSNPIASAKQVEPIEIDKSQYAVRYGDIFFTTSSETPKEVGMSSVWLYDKEHIYLNSFCFGFRPDIKIDLKYFAYFLRSPFFRSKMIILAQGISRFNISKLKVMELPVLLPSFAEQEAMGNYFHNLDELITSKRLKLAKLRNIKQACLDKMFVNTSEL